MVTVGLALLLYSVPARATDPNDLCAPTDDPCVISSKVTVDPDSTLNFGSRTLSITDQGSLTWSERLTIDAGNCLFAPKSKLVEAKGSSGTGFLILNCNQSTLAGKVTTVGAGVLIGSHDPNSDGPHVMSGSITAKGDQVGVIAWDSYRPPGHVTVSGKIIVKSKLGTPPGEFRIVTNWGNILITSKAKIKISAQTADPFSEFFWFETGSGTLTINGKIDARAKDGAYAFNFEADQDVVFGPDSRIKANATGEGAEIVINSQSASVRLQGRIQAKVKNKTDEGTVNICASDDIYVEDRASIDTSDDGFGGSIILGAGDYVEIGSGGKGAKILSKSDGDIEICGNTSGVWIRSSSKIIPEPWAVGIWECLSPWSGVIFMLDCDQ
jgi:hypothetical protein